MKIETLSLSYFRNYENAYFQFDNYMNIFIGKNAQGKTNILEALYLLSTTRSFRTHKYAQMISFDEDFAKIEGHIYSSSQYNDLKIVLSKQGKRAFINNNVIKHTSDYLGYFNTVLFLPSDLLLIQAQPKLRRQLIDLELSKISPIYLYELINYQHFLKERNAYLKKTTNLKNNDPYLDILDKKLSSLNYFLYQKRKKFIQTLSEYTNIYYQKIVENEDLKIQYKSSFLNLKEDDIFSLYKDHRLKDMKLKQTMLGIHKDDFVFILNKKNAAQFASQGQQRSIVLALKFALLDIIKKEIGEYPILLLDDVLSELDDFRKEKLFSLIPQTIQTFITTTSYDRCFDHLKHKHIIKIKRGLIDG